MLITTVSKRAALLVCILHILVHNCAFSPGHYSIWKQSRVPLAFWVDGSSQDLSAKAHSGRNHQTSLWTAPRGPGHADTHEASAGRHHTLPSRHQCKSQMWISVQRSQVTYHILYFCLNSLIDFHCFRFTPCGCVHSCCHRAEGWFTLKVKRRSCTWTLGLTGSLKSKILKLRHQRVS